MHNTYTHLLRWCGNSVPFTEIDREWLEEFICDNELLVHNNKDHPTFDCTRGRTFIDITVSNIYLETAVSDWRVDPSESHSDHKFLLYDVLIDVVDEDMKINIKRANWPAFRKYIQRNIYAIQKTHNLDSAHGFDAYAEASEELLKKALKESCPPPAVHQPMREESWWSYELTVLRDEVSALYLLWK